MMKNGGGERPVFSWPKGRLAEEEWASVWGAVRAHGLGLANVEVCDWSVEQAKLFLHSQRQRLVLARLSETEREAFLVDPATAATAIDQAFDQRLTRGVDLAVLPPEFGWCLLGNSDGELFYCVRA